MQELFDARDMTGLAEAVAAGEVSPREVVEFSAARLAERNPALNAVVSTRIEQALDEVDAGLPDGPLRGVPFLIKDLHADVAGLPSTEGSRLFADVVADRDSELVRRYRAAGLVVLGKTNIPEFGQNASTEPLLFGPARNPHRLSHSPGGSSGGSAAAVAAGIVPAAHGSDGGGSLRIPSSMTGLVGLKPSRGRTAAGNPLEAPLSVQHALTRSVRDTALLLDIASAPWPGAPLPITPPQRPYIREVGADPGRLRIAVSTTTPTGEPVHPDCAAVAQKTAALLAELGHEVTADAPDYPMESLMAAFTMGMAVPMTVQIDERLARLGRELRDDDLEALPRAIYDRIKTKSAGDFDVSMRELGRTAAQVGAFFTDHDLLLTPTLAQPTPPLGLLDANDLQKAWQHGGVYGAITSPFNVTGQPAISLPLGRDATGMPLGVQLAAPFGREDLLIRIASQLETAQPWSIAPVWPPVN
ncbi:amidase [Speluncibacter jeojiensis]|uniref:amidase n=1 Tax=Speluncibacter jeojiensis TaxID=2710754 RepID=A0A9X4LYX1_9ACTN|nr:amidase family protein [Corynebacteriales bacterium D3-21]